MNKKCSNADTVTPNSTRTSQMDEQRLSALETAMVDTKRSIEEAEKKRTSDMSELMDMLRALGSRMSVIDTNQPTETPTTSEGTSNRPLVGVSTPNSHNTIYSQSSINVEIPKFDGDSSKAADWLSDYESNATLMNWDDNTKLKCVFGAFEREIRPWYKREIQAKQDMTWQKFVLIFEKSYNIKSKRRLRIKIATLSQGAQEKARIFINKMADICLQFDEIMDEKDIVKACIGGLRPNLRRMVEKIVPKTIEELCITIEEYEQDYPTQVVPNALPNSQMNVVRRRASPYITCNNCSKQGHYTPECNEAFDAERVKKNRERFNQQRQGLMKQENINVATEAINSDNTNVELPLSEDITHSSAWLHTEHSFSANITSVVRLEKPTQPVMEVMINNKSQICIANCGATRTVVPIKKIKECDLQMYTSPFIMSMASGQKSRMNFRTKARIRYKNHQVEVGAVVVPDTQEHILLGNDFLEALKLVIDYDHHRIDYWPNLMDRFMNREDIVRWMRKHPKEIEAINNELSNTTPKSVTNHSEPEVAESDAVMYGDPDSVQCNLALGNEYANNHDINSDIDEAIPAHLNDTEGRKLKQVLSKFSDTFVKSRTDIGQTKLVEHVIDTKDHKPIAQRPYRLALKEVDYVKKLVKEMLDAGIIRHSTSPWASPIVLVGKKTGDTRMCVDYRKINAVTEQVAYPIPLMAEIEDLLWNKKFFSTIDIAAMYWRIPMRKEDQCKTAFVVPFGLYEYTVMPFGLCGAPATAVRLMNMLLSDLIRKSCFVYFDDIIIFSESFKDHLQHIEEVLQRLRDQNIKIRPKKCRFMRESVSYLGHQISAVGIRPDPLNIETVKKFKLPSTVTEVRSFTGLASFFRKFIPELAKIVAPINNLIINKKRKNEKVTWTEDASIAFERIKDLITSSPTLVHYDPNGDLELRTDACDYAIGAILLQTSRDPAYTGVLCYVSKMLKKSERNYTVTDKEAYAILWSVTKLRHYLWNKKFTVTNDHKALQYLMNIKDQNGRLARWALKLQPYRHNIIYKPGIEHGDVDYISRHPLPTTEDEEDDSDVENIPVFEAIEEDRIASEQDADNCCKPIIELLKRDDLNARQQLAIKNFKLIGERLLKKVKIDREYKYVTVVPTSMRASVLQSCHDNSAHLGIDKTYKKIATRFFWPKLKSCVSNYVNSCIHCQKRKSSNHKPYGRPQLMPAPKGLFDLVGIDTWGKVTPSSKGHKWVLTIVDHFSKWVTLVPLKKHDTITVCKKLKKHFLRIFGNPREIISDRGTNFVSEEANRFFRKEGIRRLKTSSYHPQTNGVTERFHRVLGASISALGPEERKDWHLYLKEITFAYNTSVNDTTGQTPYKLVFCKEPTIDADTLIGTCDVIDGEERMTIRDLRDSIQSAIRKTQLRNQSRTNEGRLVVNFEVNDLVLLKVPIRTLVGKKFDYIREGPFRITKKLPNPNVYEIVNLRGQIQHQVVNVERLERYHLRENENIIAPEVPLVEATLPVHIDPEAEEGEVDASSVTLDDNEDENDRTNAPSDTLCNNEEDLETDRRESEDVVGVIHDNQLRHQTRPQKRKIKRGKSYRWTAVKRRKSRK